MARPLPSDPLLRRLLAQVETVQLGRRRLLQLGLAGAGALTLAACTTPSGSPTPGSAELGSIVWASRPGELDVDAGGRHPTLDTFRRQTGVGVDYRPDIGDEADFVTGIQSSLRRGAYTGTDVACLVDWQVAGMVRAEQGLKLDHTRIPNLKNLRPALLGVDYDPTRDYTVTWQSRYAGLVYNKELVPAGVRSVADLWRPEFAGRVVVLPEMREALGVIMLGQGVDIASEAWGDDEFYNALDRYQAQLANGQIGPVRGTTYLDDLASEDAVVGIVSSADVSTVLNPTDERDGRDPRFEFVIPDAGGMLVSEDLIAIAGSPQLGLTEQLINYYYDPQVAALVAASVRRLSPVIGARDAAASIDPTLAEDPLVFPTDEDLAKAKAFRTLTDRETRVYRSAWAAAIANPTATQTPSPVTG